MSVLHLSWGGGAGFDTSKNKGLSDGQWYLITDHRQKGALLKYPCARLLPLLEKAAGPKACAFLEDLEKWSAYHNIYTILSRCVCVCVRSILLN